MSQETVRGATATYDAGLRAFMLGVYNYMAMGLALTGVVALFVASSPDLMMALFSGPMKYVVIFAPIGLVMYLSFRIDAMTASTAQTVFWIYAAVMGLSLSTVFMVYTGASVAKVFFVTAASFAGLSLYGYTTKTNLSAFRTFFFMGLIGLMVGGIVNMFLHSSGFDFLLSAAGVLIFAGLTAYDTQTIRNSYTGTGDGDAAKKLSIMGALRLYLDFINLFLYLLRFMGDRRN